MLKPRLGRVVAQHGNLGAGQPQHSKLHVRSNLCLLAKRPCDALSGARCTLAPVSKGKASAFVYIQGREASLHLPSDCLGKHILSVPVSRTT